MNAGSVAVRADAFALELQSALTKAEIAQVYLANVPVAYVHYAVVTPLAIFPRTSSRPWSAILMLMTPDRGRRDRLATGTP